MSDCDLCVVRNRAICSALNAGELAALNAIGRKRDLASGEALIWEGDDSVLVANVVSSVLKLCATTEDGREQIVGIVYPSDFIGRPFGGNSNESVIALSDAKVCVFSRADFDAFAREHPAMERKLLERTIAELDRTRRWIVLLGRKSAGERVASFLLDLAERSLALHGCEAIGGNGVPTSVPLPFTRQQIADLLGLTIETVSRQFTRLKTEGIIGLPSRREIVILDREALVAQAG